MEDTEDDPIFELAVECETLYAEQISKLNDDDQPNGAKTLGELNHRFAAWAAFLGVFAESNVCLDRRLRYHVEIQDQVLRLLDVMQRNLAYLFEQDVSSGCMQIGSSDAYEPGPQPLSISIASLEAISEAMERLNQLGVAIRQSSMMNQMAKARDFAETFDFGSFGELAYTTLKTLYANASEGLLEQLTRSMTETYALFLRRKSRQRQLFTRRARTRPSTPLLSIKEELATNTETGSLMDITIEGHQASGHSSAAMLQPPLIRPGRIIPMSEPTSMDTRVVKARLRRATSPSKQNKTMSILTSHADYPRQTKEKGIKWRQHVNADHEPFVCISEACSESLPRFATSTRWFQHMLTTHGQNWHREVYAPMSWACPLCTDGTETFPKPDDLSIHLDDFHEGTFTKSQIQAIAQQSRCRLPRPRDVCPLCCLPMKDQSDHPTRSTGSPNEALSPRNLSSDTHLPHQHERIKTETQYTQSGEKTGDEHEVKTEKRESNTPVDPSFGNTIGVEAIANHIAAHLQGIMLLTLRLISIDVEMDVSADNQSAAATTDHHSLWVSSTKGVIDKEADDIEALPLPGDDGIDLSYDYPLELIVPDSEYMDWKDIPRCGYLCLEGDNPDDYQYPSPLQSPYIQYDTETYQLLAARHNAIQELIHTEDIFRNDMAAIEDIRKKVSSRVFHVTWNEAEEVFRNSDQVARVSMDFYNSLRRAANGVDSMPIMQQRVGKSSQERFSLAKDTHPQAEQSGTSDWEKDRGTFIGKAFITQLPRMEEVNITYLKKRHTAVKRLQSLEKIPGTAAWLKECHRMVRPSGPDFALLLARPSERIQRYPILLRAILDSTPNDHPDRPFLVTALEEVTNIIALIDELDKRTDLIAQLVAKRRNEPDIRLGLFNVSSQLSRRNEPDIRLGLSKVYSQLTRLNELDIRLGLSKVSSQLTRRLEERVDLPAKFHVEEFNALSRRFDLNRLRLEVVLINVELYVSEARKSVETLRGLVRAFHIFSADSRGYSDDDRFEIIRFDGGDKLQRVLTEHISLVRKKVMGPISEVLKLHEGAQTAMQERNKHLVHYVHSETTDLRLKEEVHKLLSLSAQLLGACLNSFVQIQASWFSALQEKLVHLVREDDPVANHVSSYEDFQAWYENLHDQEIRGVWSSKFQLVDQEVGRLGICNGSYLEETTKRPYSAHGREASR
ncbi:hypothetical protein FQN53_006236 [Emmonsiellopsis sp. PD_33]|nr:hypothetical protein FQN53_006236 [Emmonsiellopsis sp. PD_33]